MNEKINGIISQWRTCRYLYPTATHPTASGYRSRLTRPRHIVCSSLTCVTEVSPLTSNAPRTGNFTEYNGQHVVVWLNTSWSKIFYETTDKQKRGRFEQKWKERPKQWQSVMLYDVQACGPCNTFCRKKSKLPPVKSTKRSKETTHREATITGARRFWTCYNAALYFYYDVRKNKLAHR